MKPSNYEIPKKIVLDKALGYEYFVDPGHPLVTGAAGRVYLHRHLGSVIEGRWLTREDAVHHINEDRSDNRIKNLVVMSHAEHAKLHQPDKRVVLLCPECDETFLGRVGRTFCSVSCAGKMSRKFEVSKDDLEDLIANNSMVAVGKMFGVSDNAIRKRAKTLSIDLPTRISRGS